MQVQINSSGGLRTSTEDRTAVVAVLNDQLGRFDDFVRRIELHLHPCDPGGRTGREIDCGLEACFGGKRPLRVHHADRSVEQAVRRSSSKPPHQPTKRCRRCCTKSSHD